MQKDNQKFKIIKKELPEVQRNISLAECTTFKIGGRAEYFLKVKNKKDLIKAILITKKHNLPFFILGEGSNLLISEKDFNGLIIKIQNSNVFKSQKYNSKFKIFCEAGIPLPKLVSKSLEVWATGLEWAAGIPGTVGGAIYGNAGAFGSSIADIIEKVEVLDVGKKLRWIKKKDCRFGYRNSIFKKNKSMIVISAVLNLEKGNREKIRENIKKNLIWRLKTQPLGSKCAGSIFKNFTSSFLKKERAGPALQAVIKKFDGKDLIPAAYLIEKCGLKGKKIGGAQISQKHANFIINKNGAKAEDVIRLIDLIKKKVKKKFRVELKKEIQYLGF